MILAPFKESTNTCRGPPATEGCPEQETVQTSMDDGSSLPTVGAIHRGGLDSDGVRRSMYSSFKSGDEASAGNGVPELTCGALSVSIMQLRNRLHLRHMCHLTISTPPKGMACNVRATIHTCLGDRHFISVFTSSNGTRNVTLVWCP